MVTSSGRLPRGTSNGCVPGGDVKWMHAWRRQADACRVMTSKMDAYRVVTSSRYVPRDDVKNRCVPRGDVKNGGVPRDDVKNRCVPRVDVKWMRAWRRQVDVCQVVTSRATVAMLEGAKGLPRREGQWNEGFMVY